MLPLKNKNYNLEYQAFSRYIKGQPIPKNQIIILGLKSLVAFGEMLIRYIPGGVGYKLRYWFYKATLKHLGKEALIDVGVFLNGWKNISIGEYTWIDSGCRIEAMLGEITIGKRVHIAPYAIIGAREPVVIEDYAAVGAGAKIYANSEYPGEGKRMSGPMIPEEYKAFYSKKIILGKDCCVGTEAVLLPGAQIGEGAVVGANAVVTKPVKAWTIVAGVPAKVIGKRAKVTMPDL
ncbi:hypothetical protein A2W24_05605 [Microgenomates group bacterium RBG_16_45_19]|nr:MAG: hypothetical protein A2W24_05605 [Microgenomates group bacterium RBG_16_45_19]